MKLLRDLLRRPRSVVINVDRAFTSVPSAGLSEDDKRFIVRALAMQAALTSIIRPPDLDTKEVAELFSLAIERFASGAAAPASAPQGIDPDRGASVQGDRPSTSPGPQSAEGARP